MATIGFIGIGNMGTGMARNLVRAGHEVTVFDLDTEKARDIEGATVAGSGEAAAAGRDIVITMLPAGPVVAKVYRDTIRPNAAPDTLFIDCSTIDVETARVLAGEASGEGFAMLDAPVSGGVAGADAGTLAFMVGGSAEGFARAEPVLAVMGAKVVHCGEAGAGQGIKICNNMMLAIQMISVAEGFALAEKLGLSPQSLFDVSSAASGQCWSLTTYCPMPGVGPQTSADNGYKPGFAAGLMHKDLGLAMAAAEQAGADVAFGRAAFEAYDRMVGAGDAGVDFSGVIRAKRGVD